MLGSTDERIVRAAETVASLDELAFVGTELVAVARPVGG
jgi:hypothetical protein